MLRCAVRSSLLAVVALGVSLPATISGQGTFTPGAREIVGLSFANARAGEVPAGLTLLSGSLAVVEKDGVRMLRAATPSEFLVTLPEVLPQDFTLEFDLIPKKCCNPEDLAFEGTPTLSRSTSSAQVSWSRETQLVVGGGEYFQAATPPALQPTLPGQFTRIIASFEGNTLKLYTNGQRLYTLSERRFARGWVLRVFLGGKDDDKQAVYLARLRIAAGAGSVTTAASAETATSSQASTAAPAVATGLVVTVDAQGKASLKWDPVPDAASYVVVRWNVNDLSCCNNVSPPGATSTATWQDGVLPKAGTYGYRVYATTSTGTVLGETRVSYQNGVVSAAGTIGAAGSGRIATAAPAPVTTMPVATQTGTITPIAPTPTPASTLATSVPGMRLPSIGAQATAVSPSSLSLNNCDLFGNLKASVVSVTSAKLTWNRMSSTCESLAKMESGALWWYYVLRWVTGDPSGCPSTYDDVLKSTNYNSLVLTGYPSCTWAADIDAWSTGAWGTTLVDAVPITSVDDNGLEVGGTYSYRIWPVFGSICGQNSDLAGCPDGYHVWSYSPAEATVTLPLLGRVSPKITAVLGLRATLGATSCNQYTNYCDVEVTYAWNPIGTAVSYVLSFDTREPPFVAFYPSGQQSIPASQAPSFKTKAWQGTTLRACLGIVTDPANPPDPRQGECIETVFQ